MATYLLNILPNKKVSFQTPLRVLYRKIPSYSHLQVFGCLCLKTFWGDNDFIIGWGINTREVSIQSRILGIKSRKKYMKSIIRAENIKSHMERFYFLHSPSSWSVKITNAQLAQEITEAFFPKRFSEDICHLVLRINV